MDIVASEIDIACNVTGTGDVSLACDNCEMVLGGDSNAHYPNSLLHLSNNELSNIRVMGSVTFGSGLSQNVLRIYIDGAVFISDASTLNIIASQGPISFRNMSSEFKISSDASFLTKSSSNVTIDSNVTIETLGATGDGVVTFYVDSDCSVTDNDLFVISSEYTSLTVFTSAAIVVISTPGIVLGGQLNVSSSRLLRFEGASSSICGRLFR